MLLFGPAAALRFLAKHFPINESPSMPRGVYVLTSRPITRGAIVGACIPESFATLAKERGYLHSGTCRSGVRPVMKYIAALPGDSVEIRHPKVLINGEAIPNTEVLTTDPLGRPIPNQIGFHTVRPGEYWLISNLDRGSFDSRYFGPVTEILGAVEPLITEKDTESRFVINAFLDMEALTHEKHASGKTTRD